VPKFVTIVTIISSKSNTKDFSIDLRAITDPKGGSRGAEEDIAKIALIHFS
jgi:hypothetical protein